MHFQNVSGDYFPTGNSTNKLPSDATNSNVKFAQKVTGSIYNTNTGKLESNKVLSALGIYAEGHDSWFVDETAFMGGPTDWSSFSDHVENIDNGDDTKVVYTTNADYTIMYAVPLPENDDKLLGSSKEEEYNPLVSYKNMSLDVPKKTTKKDGTIGQIIIIVIGIITLGFVTFTVVSGKRKKKKKEEKK